KDGADDRAAEQEIDSDFAEPDPPDVRDVDLEIALPAQSASHLELGTDQEGPQARQADVGREIGEALIEPEEAGEEQAESQMEAVERAAADEHAHGHGRRLLLRRGPLGTQLVEQ